MDTQLQKILGKANDTANIGTSHSAKFGPIWKKSIDILIAAVREVVISASQKKKNN